MIYKKGRYYMVNFMWQGKVIRKSTRCSSARDARTVEGKFRSELGKGNWGVLEAKPRLTLDEFLRKDFLPYTESKFQSTPRHATITPTGQTVCSNLTLRGFA